MTGIGVLKNKMGDSTISPEILDDLSSRFIINVPEEERKDLIRICFQIELAHWFYLDFYISEYNTKFKHRAMNEFALQIFNHIPFLRPHVGNIDVILKQWWEYKQSVPTFGAIVLNEDLTEVLLVQSYYAKNSWSFPKGKVNEDEDPSHCAVREVFEETGFDISNLINKNEYIESMINDQLVRLYIICGVQKDTKFEPQCRKEIGKLAWFVIEDLPTKKKDMTVKIKTGLSASAFFMVYPFVRRMKRWIQLKQQRDENVTTVRRQRHKSLGDVESVPKSKRQQQLSQSVQSEIPDYKNGRQSNTSPARLRRNTFDSKNMTKGTFKRNLFGDQGEDQSPILAKQLTDSPQAVQACPLLRDPAIQSVMCNDFNYKAQYSEQETKDTAFEYHQSRNSDVPEGNIKSLLFGKAARKLQIDLKDMPSPFAAMNNSISPFLTPNRSGGLNRASQFSSKIWSHFKFDRQTILNCL